MQQNNKSRKNKANAQTRKNKLIMDCDEKAKQIQKRREHRQLQQYYLEKGLEVPLQSSLKVPLQSSSNVARPIYPLMDNPNG